MSNFRGKVHTKSVSIYESPLVDEVMIDSKMPAYVKTPYKGNKIMMQLFGIIGI